MVSHGTPTAVPPEERLLAVTIPGRPLCHGWNVIGDGKAVCAMKIFDADQVPDLMVAVLPERTDVVLPGRACIVYWTVDRVNYSLLGALNMEKPSAMFRTGWGGTLSPGSIVELTVSIESAEFAQNLGIDILVAGGVEERRNFARAIARDLWNFLTSFSQRAPGAGGVQSNGEMMLIPTNILDHWMTRFDSKYKRDPNFMMK